MLKWNQLSDDVQSNLTNRPIFAKDVVQFFRGNLVRQVSDQIKAIRRNKLDFAF